MAKVAVIQEAFNGGEFSPLMEGRVSFDKYGSALRTCLNAIPLVQGAWTRRPGTYFVVETKNSAKQSRLVRFEFSTTQAYVLEFGDLYFRICMNHGQIVSGTPVEVVTTYAEADLFQLKFAQSADVLYVAHPAYPPRKISRTSHTSWSITTIDFLDGPYLPTNSGATTLALSGLTGSVTVTASAVTGINSDAGFKATDVGRLIRWKDAAGNWTWLKITAFTDTLNVTADVKGPAASATTATVNWRLGEWSATTGYPGAVTFYEDRLCWGGSSAKPQTVNGSRSSDYENMASTEADGTVTDSNAIQFTLNSNNVQVIRWLIDNEKGLLSGTTGGEWIIRPSNLNEALTPTNVKAVQSTRHGSANIQVLGVAKVGLYVQKAGRKLRELAYDYYSDGFLSPDMTVLAEHVTRGATLAGSGIKDLAYQQEPHTIVWAPRNDGVLLGFTYERDQKVICWHRHPLGGNGIVESVACIPAPDGTRDELWLLVRRTIGGVTKRYIEYMAKVWDKGDAQADAFFVDCGLTYSGSPVTTITGLGHLIGETVTILADGAAHPTRTVDGTGSITLARAASKVQVGYGYNSDGQLLRNNAGAADGTAQGKTQRTHFMTFRVVDTLGLKTGRDFDNLTPAVPRRTTDDLGAAVPLYTGDLQEQWEGDYTTDNTPCWRIDQPFPATILAIMPQQMTQDR